MKNEIIYTNFESESKGGTSLCFEGKLHTIITKTIPEIYQLLRANKIKNAEDMIIEELNPCIGVAYGGNGS